LEKGQRHFNEQMIVLSTNGAEITGHPQSKNKNKKKSRKGKKEF
jgi:hypothetical protein